MDGKRKHFVVITAYILYRIKQDDLLLGIIKEAKKHNIDITIISNITNHRTLCDENYIYKLAKSEYYDGIIITEYFLFNETLKNNISDIIKEINIPVICLGRNTLNISKPNISYLNANDIINFYKLTEHLITKHNFTNIHVVAYNDKHLKSENMLKGFYKAIKQYNLSEEKNIVFFAENNDLWVASGIFHAKKYISGELKLPEAIICTDVFIAYKLLDIFYEVGIKVPDDVSIMAYGFNEYRTFHIPLLSSFNRDNETLGKNAVRFLMYKCNLSTEYIEKTSDNIFILGESCGCSPDLDFLMKEHKSNNKAYQIENQFILNDFYSNIGNCNSLKEFLDIISEHMQFIGNYSNCCICLQNNWYDINAAPSKQLICYPINTTNSSDINQFLFSEENLYDFYEKFECIATYYMFPLSFGKHKLGYFIFQYQNSDVNNHNFQNWIQFVCTALYSLILKNQFDYMKQAQNISENHDIVTGLYHANGLINALNTLLSSNSQEQSLFMLILKIDVHIDLVQTKDFENEKYIAEVIKEFCDGINSICGHIEANTFVIAIIDDAALEYKNLLIHKLKMLLFYNEYNIKMNDFTIHNKIFNKNSICVEYALKELYEKCAESVAEKLRQHRTIAPRRKV